MKNRISRISPPQRRGFTLTEVLLVLAILGVIAAMVVPNLIARQQDALKRSTKNNINALERIVDDYVVAHDGEFPQSINVLMNPGQDKEGKTIAPFVTKLPKDGWDQPLHFEYPNSKGGATDKPAIWSSGKNRQDEQGSGDDINNWSDK